MTPTNLSKLNLGFGGRKDEQVGPGRAQGNFREQKLFHILLE